MPNISSKTLFHFTSSLDNLKAILSGGIRYGMFAEKIPIRPHLAYFVRGISFCNIPLSMVSEHVDWYGKYAIGLRRSLLREQGASPVFYVHSKTRQLPKGSNAASLLQNNPFLCLMKQHYGTQFHKNKGEYVFKHFDNEKEWRICEGPTHIEPYTTTDKLEKSRRTKDKNEKNYKALSIPVDSIEYIILEKPSDFDDFKSFIEKYSLEDREKYLTKILFYSQIKNDF